MIRDALFSPPDMPLWLPRLVFSVTLVCLAAALGNFLLRRFSAAMRHRVWALGIAASLAMPAMILWSPELRLGWLNVAAPHTVVVLDPLPEAVVRPAPVPHQFAPPVAETGGNSSAAPSKVLAAKNQTIPKTTPAQTPVAIAASTQTDPRPSQAPVMSAATTPTSFFSRVLDRNVLWLLILVVPALGGAWQSVRCARGARRVVEEAQLIRDPATLELVADVCRRLGWNRTIEVRQTKRTPIPLCIGWWKPCVLLPPGWRSWGDLTLRAVLAHEVSHVVRRDVAWQFAARIACFLYWFHPLVWLAARKMRIERESACDDSVLELVEQPVDYASVLLRFAREMVARTTPATALPMAGLSGLEGRVQAILDKGRRRSPVGTRAGRIFTAAALLIAAAAASLSPLSWDITDAIASDGRTGGSAASDQLQANKWLAAGELTGRVVLGANARLGAARAKILGIPDNPKAPYVTAVADVEGNFHVPRIGSAMLFLAENDERTFTGMARFDPQQQNVLIRVGRSVSAIGRLLDSTGKPLASWPLEYCLTLEGSFLDEYHVFQARDAKRSLGGAAMTGPNGEFMVPGLVPGWTYRISCCPGTLLNGVIQPFITISTFTAAASGVSQLGNVTRPRTDTLDDVFLSESSTPQQMEKLLASEMASAKMLDLHVLVIAGSRENVIVRGIRSNLALSTPVPWTPPSNTPPKEEPQWARTKDNKVERALTNYTVMALDMTGPAPTAHKFLNQHKLSVPASGDMLLAVLNENGQVVSEINGQKLFGGKEPNADALFEWLRSNKPKLPDAEKLFQAALGRAQRENKRVFLRENSPSAATYCARLNCYIEKYKDLIDKDYVCLKIDVRCPNAIKVINGIRDYDMKDYSSSGSFTLPWMVILDSAGRPVASGTSPHGNIGIPESAQETSYYAWMLRASAQRLTDEEISKLVAGFSAGKI